MERGALGPVTRTASALTVAGTIAAATLLFWVVVHQVSGLWLDVAFRPEMKAALERSMEDQKTLRELDPRNRDAYRRRFDETQKLLHRIEVIRMNRAAMVHRLEMILLAVFAVSATAAGVIIWLRFRKARLRERREYVERVTSLQETARRHAHEIKGPLTAARLELERYGDLVRAGADDDEIVRARESVHEELERLARYTREFSSFAGLGAPVLRRESLESMIAELCTTFAGAWPGMELRRNGSDRTNVLVCADRDMLRQVLVNLCSNSARAGSTAVSFSVSRTAGRVTLDVADDGGGIPDALRPRVFDPYVTTRKVGEGMGLGLSISRKVMLDHGGDLELVESSEAGTTFRVKFGAATCE